MRKLAGLGVMVLAVAASVAQAQIKPALACERTAFQGVKLQADAPVTIVDVAPSEAVRDAQKLPYCLVKLSVPEAINIWVGLPMEWNGRLVSIGGGGYVGRIGPPALAIEGGYVGVTTDTGHTGTDGSFGMLAPGKPNRALQVDFAYRSEHLMGVLGKQVAQAFYRKAPQYSYWNGCSTGGRQGLMMAQRFPDDYDGVLAGAPAIHWDRFQAAQLWPQIAMRVENGAPVGKHNLDLATRAAVAACDAQDGVSDGIINDPRSCSFDAKSLVCSASSPGEQSCLTEKEASAIDKIWAGPQPQWFGLTRGAVLNALAGPDAFFIAMGQARYWVYLNPEWDWRTLSYENFGTFFNDTVKAVGPLIATDNPDLGRFRRSGGKLIVWHGWSDQLIMPEGSIRYYDAVVKQSGGLADTQRFARLFMAPGVAHCAGGDGPQPRGLFEALTKWVEQGEAPDRLQSVKSLPSGATRTRPLCMYPTVARWTGQGSTDEIDNFRCER